MNSLTNATAQAARLYTIFDKISNANFQNSLKGSSIYYRIISLLTLRIFFFAES